MEEQRGELAKIYQQLVSTGLVGSTVPFTQNDFFWAVCAVRSRTFSGPYVGSTMQVRCFIRRVSPIGEPSPEAGPVCGQRHAGTCFGFKSFTHWQILREQPQKPGLHASVCVCVGGGAVVL